ncbi:hypothetical protein MTO96_036435 [Rhipicephalus appendiculatus]
MARAYCVSFCLLLLAVGYCFAAGDVLTPEKCGGDFKEVRVNPCPQLPCKFERGKSVGIEVDFTPGANFDRPQATFKGELTPGTWLPSTGLQEERLREKWSPVPPGSWKAVHFLQAGLSTAFVPDA